MAVAGTTRCVLRLVAVEDAPAPAADALAGRRVVVLGGETACRGSVVRRLAEHGGDVVDVADEPAEVWSGHVRSADVVVDLNVTGTDTVAAGMWRSALRDTYRVLGAVAEDWRREHQTGRCGYVAVVALGGLLGADPAAVRQPLTGIWSGLAKTLTLGIPCMLGTGRRRRRRVAGGGRSRRRTVRRPVRRGRVVGRAAARAAAGPAARRAAWTPARPVRGGCVHRRGARDRVPARPARAGCVGMSGRRLRPARPCGISGGGADRRRGVVPRDARRAAAGCRGGEGLRAARAEIARLVRARELWRNLEAARRAGQALEYRCADVTDPAAVVRLLDGVCAPIAALVHDAGLDRPARVGRKPVEDAEAVVAVKVDGFLNVVAALGRRPVRVMCAVGSLTGRFGGTAGQTDYAGANEALARLAGWAQGRVAGTVTCLSWPTWEAAGLVTNPDAAVREMSAVPVEAGVTGWEQELREPAAGEVLHVGEVAALAPPQLRSLPVPSDYPASGALLARRHLLGEVQSWHRRRSFVTWHRFGAAEFHRRGGLPRRRATGRAGVLAGRADDRCGGLAGAAAAAGRQRRRPARPAGGRRRFGAAA